MYVQESRTMGKSSNSLFRVGNTMVIMMPLPKWVRVEAFAKQHHANDWTHTTANLYVLKHLRREYILCLSSCMIDKTTAKVRKSTTILGTL
jgi:hypothetical protein